MIRSMVFGAIMGSGLAEFGVLFPKRREGVCDLFRRLLPNAFDLPRPPVALVSYVVRELAQRGEPGLLECRKRLGLQCQRVS